MSTTSRSVHRVKTARPAAISQVRNLPNDNGDDPVGARNKSAKRRRNKNIKEVLLSPAEGDCLSRKSLLHSILMYIILKCNVTFEKFPQKIYNIENWDPLMNFLSAAVGVYIQSFLRHKRQHFIKAIKYLRLEIFNSFTFIRPTKQKVSRERPETTGRFQNILIRSDRPLFT